MEPVLPMSSPTVPVEGQTLTGSLFHEPMRVETVAATGPAVWTLGLVGTQSREQFGVNQWMEHPRVVKSLDLAKRDDVLPSLRQVHWDLVIVAEAHRMSARDESHKSQSSKLGELLRDSSDNRCC